MLLALAVSLMKKASVNEREESSILLDWHSSNK
jgi:hypothetical protein